jgi:RNA polymerase sigma factor (TIGR02999 family)
LGGQPATSGKDVGDRRTDEFLTVAYHELRRLAQFRMSQESRQMTLQPTALLHEAYLRVVASSQGHFQNQAHFFAAVAEAMRRILVERARRRGRLRHGAGRAREDLSACHVEADNEDSEVDVVAIDGVLVDLEKFDPDMASLVKLRFFAGLTCDEAAAALGMAQKLARCRSLGRLFRV